MSMKFIRNTRQKIVIDSGAISLLRPWKVSRTSPSTKPTMVSTKAWNLPGTPEATLRAASQNDTKNSVDSTKVKINVSTLSVMNVLSPTLTCQKCRWWLMYSVEPPVAASVIFSALTLCPCRPLRPQPAQTRQPGHQSRHQTRQHRQRWQLPSLQRDTQRHEHHQPLRGRPRQQRRESEPRRHRAPQREQRGED